MTKAVGLMVIVGVASIILITFFNYSNFGSNSNSAKGADGGSVTGMESTNGQVSDVSNVDGSVTGVDGVDKAETVDVEQKDKDVAKENIYITEKEVTTDLEKDTNTHIVADEIMPQKHIYPYCTESDGGPKYETQGTLTRCVEEGNCLTEIDTCLSDTTLLEYYCKEGGSMSTLEQNCEAGCSNGACLPVVEVEEKVELSDELVQESKENIMTYGFSDDYFDDHFTFVSASKGIVNGAHVTWSFEVGEYETELRDGIGCNNCGKDNMNYVHSISPAFVLDPPVIGEIESVISKSKADELMASCVGDDFIEEKVQLNLMGPTRGLLFTASPKDGAYECPTDGMAPCINKIGVVDLVTGSVLECNS